MWQRFTERARRAVFFAHEESHRLGANLISTEHHPISTEHLLLGVLRDDGNLACAVLFRIGIPHRSIRSDLARQLMPKASVAPQNIEFTPSGRRVLELAYEEARLLGNEYIGTEHILLGLLRETEGQAARLLHSLGADLERAREEAVRLQAAEAQRLAPLAP